MNSLLLFVKRFASSTAFMVAFATSIRGASQNGSLNEEETRRIFLQLAQDIVPKFQVEIRKTAKRENSDRNSTKAVARCLIDGNDTALFLHHLEKENMKTEALEVLGRLGKEAASIELTAFDNFFPQLLRSLLQLQIPLAEQRYRNLFRKLLLAYATRYVQTEPPSGDWARRPEGCGCADCDRLDRFLADPLLQSKKFSVSKNRRHHLHCMLNDTEYTHETDRRGIETLVVTKPASHSLAKYEQWKVRFDKAKRKIRELDQGVLKELLGEDYEYLTRLSAARRGAGGLPSAKKVPRRKGVEVVDLT